jgi:signal transduction histidine kinase/CheY-like chemotaxis protein
VELRSSNEDLGTQASRLAEQNIEVERKNKEVELAKRLVEEKAEQLAVSSKYKSEFFSNMSHELRTPLNSLLMLAGELKDNPEHNLTEAQVQYASVIHSSGTDLLRLLNDILDLAKVESGTVTLQISDLPLVELKRALERDFGHVANKKGLGFSVELSPGLPPTIATDPGRLRQVLKNLLANAFKFTEQGEVSLQIGRADNGWNAANENLAASDAVTAFRIADTGIGITPAMQKRIFESFAQADGTTARQYGGTGLGLSISRELVRLLGGEIALSSTPNEGSTFTVYLPPDPKGDAGTQIASASDALIAELSVPAESPALAELAGVKALVVDDDLGNIFALTTVLERGRLEVVAAESGAEALAMLEQMPDIDIVLVDIMMPVMDGYATMRAMRELPVRGDIPIVALTANVAAGERQRCIDAGASAYVSKPVESADLMLVLGQCVAAVAAPV